MVAFVLSVSNEFLLGLVLLLLAIVLVKHLLGR